MLSAANNQYDRQGRLIAVGVAAATRAWKLDRVDLLAPTLATLQVKAAQESERAVNAMVAEQGLVAPTVGALGLRAFSETVDGLPLGSLLEQADTLSALLAMTVTQIADTGRVASGVATVARPKLDGFIRHVGATCCKRCALLAGRFYRYDTGWVRHINCRCTMVPTTTGGYGDIIETPDDLFREGRIHDLSRAERAALEDGADFSRLINASRGGMSIIGGKTRTTTELARKGRGRARLTPCAIYRLASTRDEAIRLLVDNGYIV